MIARKPASPSPTRRQIGYGEGYDYAGDLPMNAIVEDAKGNLYMVVSAIHWAVRAVPYVNGKPGEISADTQTTFNLRPGDNLDVNERPGPLYFTAGVYSWNKKKILRVPAPL
jgi:hypothetical protein